MSFSIQHPDLSSGLLAPKGASVAEFRSLRCFLYLLSDSATTRPRKRKRDDLHLPILEDDVYADLSPQDKLAVENFILDLNCAPATLNGEGGQDTDEHVKKVLMKATESLTRHSLIEVLFEQLIHRNNRAYKGFQLSGHCSSQSPLQLAPAVFQFPYVQVGKSQEIKEPC